MRRDTIARETDPELLISPVGFAEVALSIRQPWIELILQRRKTIEVRSWATRYRGNLWLHAGKKLDRQAISVFSMQESIFETGAILGRCELVDCFEFDADTWENCREQHLNPGSLERRLYAWIIRCASRVPPVPMKGRLGLMKVSGLPK